jgi:hypothetical protein
MKKYAINRERTEEVVSTLFSFANKGMWNKKNWANRRKKTVYTVPQRVEPNENHTYTRA